MRRREGNRGGPEDEAEGMEPRALLCLPHCYASYLGRVHQVDGVKELPVGKGQHGQVKLEEGAHHTKVDVARHLGAKLVRHHPRDGLAHNLSLVVDALDTEEDLAQGTSTDDVRHELGGKPLAARGVRRLVLGVWVSRMDVVGRTP